MPVLYITEPYSDTLLALGIAAAYNVVPQYAGRAYQFPDTGDDLIAFPQRAEEGEEVQVPFTYHRFKDSAITALAGHSLVEGLTALWHEYEPTYAEILEYVLPVPTITDWSKTRFAKGGYVGSATFRPLAQKGYNNTKADGLGTAVGEKEFWLLDTLRAIGFLTFAQPKLYRRESGECRWQVFVPCVPDERFCAELLRVGELETSVRTQVAAHLIASELQIPRLEVAQYAELNPLARTVMKLFTLQPNSLSDAAIRDLRMVNSSLNNITSDATQIAIHLLHVLDDGSHHHLAKLSMLLAHWQMNKPNAFIKVLQSETVTELVTCAKLYETVSR